MENTLEFGIIIFVHRLPGSTPPLEYGIFAPDPPSSHVAPFSVPYSFLRPNKASTVLLPVHDMDCWESGRTVVKLFDCILNPVTSNGTRGAPKWPINAGAPEDEQLPPPTMRQVIGVYVFRLRLTSVNHISGSLKDHIIQLIASTPVHFHLSSLDWVSSAIRSVLRAIDYPRPLYDCIPRGIPGDSGSIAACEHAITETIAKAIRRDYFYNGLWQGPVHIYEAEPEKPADERCTAGTGHDHGQPDFGMSLPRVCVKRLPSLTFL